MFYVLLFYFISQVFEIRSNISFFSGNSKRTLGLQDQILYPAYEGFFLSRGMNLNNSVFFAFVLDSDVSAKIVAEPFFSYPRQEEPIYLHRFSSSLGYKFFFIEGGKDTISLGPGVHNSLLLSRNIRPQNFFALKIKDLELPCIGNFCLGALSFTTGFIFADDDSYKFPDPTFWIMSFSWDIWALRLGASRIIGFGGKGGWKPKNLKDYFDLFTAKYENAIGVCDWIQDEQEKKRCYDYWSSRDTNQVAEVFGVVKFSEIMKNFGVELFEDLSGYFEYGGDDIVACWQVEDKRIKSCFPSPFGFTDAGWVVGLQGITRNDWLFQIEYTWFNKMRKFYAHSNYPMVVNGKYLGAHNGPLSDDIWIKVAKNLYGLYVGGVFHFTSRWSGLYQIQEKTYEFGPRISFDFDGDSKTLGFSPTIYIVKNPDSGDNPFEPNFRIGTFVDFSISFVFISRF